MGLINAEKMLTYLSSQPLFDKVKKRLSSFDALGLIDDGDFYDHIFFVIEELGLGVYQECQAVIPICDGVGQLPKNFREYHATYKLRADHGNPPDINEQKPVIFYQATEFHKEANNKCCIDCVGCDEGKIRVVVRTFVNGDNVERSFAGEHPMILSPNAGIRCGEDHHHLHKNVFRSHENELTITDDKKVKVNFKKGELYMQYYGLPFDENELPMVPDQKDIIAAIEYRIYSQLFEEFLWNSTVPNIGPLLQDARAQYEFYFQSARYWSKLPSFKRMVQSIRRQRSMNKFWYAISERTQSPTFNHHHNHRR